MLVRLGGGTTRRAREKNPPKKPCLATLLTILSLSAWLKRRFVVIRQATILKHYARTAGAGFGTIARRTLNRKLATLERLGYLHRLVRHARRRNGTWHYRATGYTLGLAALELVKQLRQITKGFSELDRRGALSVVANGGGRLAVTKMSHNQKSYIKPSGSAARAVNKRAPHQSRPPRHKAARG